MTIIVNQFGSTYTIQWIINECRKGLSDTLRGRYSDDDLLKILIECLLRIRLYRPDIFVGSFLTPPSTLTVDDYIPFPEEIVPAVIDYVSARADSANDEAALRARAPMFYQLFTQDTKG